MSEQPAFATRSISGGDPVPLLPRGQILFESIPLKAVVLEAMAPALGHGALVVRDRDRGAAVLVRDGALVEAHAFSGGSARTGDAVLGEVQGWTDAVVSAHRLDPLLVDVSESLLRGEIIYSDLRLEWVEWPSLLGDFCRRGGAYALEIFTPAGRGVTCVAVGQQVLSFTDIHPDLGDPALLEAMAKNKDGSIRVRRLNAATFAGTALASGVHAAVAAQPAPAGASPAAGAGPAPAGVAATEDRDRGDAAATNDGAAADEGGPAADPVRPAAAEVMPDLAWVAPWQTPWRDESALVDEPTRDRRPASPPVGEVLGDLRSIAQRRLQLSAPRVEAVLDEAAREERTVDAVLEEIRAMSIRGVMPATVDAMVAEMSAAASRSTN